MILLQIDTRNENVALTLFEKTTISDAYYLFEFENTQTKVKHYFLAPDTSDYPQQYNLFSLKAISSGMPDTADGEFLCKHTDFWNYTIREQESDSNLDPALSGAIVETGIVRVDISRPEIAVPLESQTTKVYGN